MTTESFCSIGGQQEAQQRQRHQQPAKQTIAPTTRTTREDIEAGKEESCISLEDREQQTEAKSLHLDDRGRLIDSRSILANKQRLKRFWEQKMEMEFKFRQQSDSFAQIQQASGACNGSNNKQIAANQALDENNNNTNDSDNASQQLQAPQSDEEWRSLSPNVGFEPSSSALGAATSRKSDTANIGGECANKKPQQCRQVSAQLVSEKLREYQRVTSARGSAEIQLMSIDPTLCHAVCGSRPTREEANESPDSVIIVREDSAEDEDLNDDEEEREEQKANESFSSGSGSSFGPISMAGLPEVGGKLMMAKAENGFEVQGAHNGDDEEELESAQSGSVSTVIARVDPQVKEKAEMVKGDLRDETSNGAEGGDGDEESIHIGVAFESLQFDSEIKSSREEKVDDELLLATSKQSQPKRPQVSKFDANEVKSVCSFITAAISDATKQVDNLINGSGKQTSSVSPIQVRETERVRNEQNGDEEEDSSELQDCSLLRANFVQESAGPIVNLSPDDEEARELEQEEEEVPKADLSSIFEANVRREIERFESNSMVRRQANGGKLSTSKNGLTEWRIAEEIRLFNERENELKRRLETNGYQNSASLASSSSLSSLPSAGGSLNQQVAGRQEACSSRGEQLEAIVRFGKTLQIPRAAKATSGEHSLSSTNCQLTSKSIKLTTSVTNQANGTNQSKPNTISMHKFISSGGKRFVLTSAGSGSGSPIQQQQQFTKSMSNLSSIDSKVPKTIDYKAADSLKCKETPNVKPGLTKKAIETFSRLSHDFRGDNCATTVAQQRQHQHQPQQQQFPHQQPSAEWKIQEELREMRAREAELRDQRGKFGAKVELENGASQAQTNEQAQAKGTEDRANTESLYPIKQAIDSFRKLNSSAQLQQQRANNHHQVPSKQQNNNHNYGSATKCQRKFVGLCELAKSEELQSESITEVADCDYKVGGQRRKISMIEKWESRRMQG